MISPVDLELASYVSWPAFEQVGYQGWILRFAEGYTKRCNSVNVLAPAEGNLVEAVAYGESFFKARHQPAIFRQLSFNCDPRLDLHLADAGYMFVEPSLVLCQTLDRDFEATGRLIEMDRVAWLKVFDEISGSDSSKQANHAKILGLIPANSLFVVLECGGRFVACGLGVIHESYFGIFDIMTRKEDRQQGRGAQLLKSMLAWARDHGGRYAYAQVVGHNAPAIRLYEKLGYRRLYHYWYRVQKAASVK